MMDEPSRTTILWVVVVSFALVFTAICVLIYAVWEDTWETRANSVRLDEFMGIIKGWRIIHRADAAEIRQAVEEVPQKVQAVMAGESGVIRGGVIDADDQERNKSG